MARTAREVVRGALGMLGVYSRGLNLAAEDANLGFAKLKDMLAQWSAEGSHIPLFTKDSVTIPAATLEMTVGAGQTIDVTMPVFIHGFVLSASNNNRRLTPMSFDEWYRDHDSEAGVPSRFFYQYNVNGELKLDRPSTNALPATMWSKKPYTDIASIDSDLLLSFDEADIPALQFNLAIDCAPDFDQTPNEATVTRALDYKRTLEIRRSQPLVAQSSMTHYFGSVDDSWQ